MSDKYYVVNVHYPNCPSGGIVVRLFDHKPTIEFQEIADENNWDTCKGYSLYYVEESFDLPQYKLLEKVDKVIKVTAIY